MSIAQFMNDEYFEEYIFAQNKRIKKFSEALGMSDTPQKKELCGKYLLGLYKNLLSAEYSLGKNRNQLAETFAKYIELADRLPVSDYAEFTDSLSLMILFDYSECENLLNTQKFNDSLTLKLKEFIRGKNYTPLKKSLAYPEYYGIFDGYLNNETSLNDFTEYMEKKWYESCREFSFYDTHKSPENVYTGYWCWLGSAVLKMKGETCISKYIPIFNPCE